MERLGTTSDRNLRNIFLRDVCSHFVKSAYLLTIPNIYWPSKVKGKQTFAEAHVLVVLLSKNRSDPEIWKAVFRLLHLTTVLIMQWQWSNAELFTDLLSSFKIRLQLLKFTSMSCFALIPIIVYKQYVLHLSLAWGPHNCVKCNVNQVKHLVLTRCNIRVIFFQTFRCICLLRVDNFTH